MFARDQLRLRLDERQSPINTETITNDVTAICALPDDTDIRDKQHNCPDFKDIVEYLKNGSLPNDDSVARKITVESDEYTLLDDTLYHL